MSNITYDIEAGQTIDEILDSFLYNSDHLNIVFEKPCGYRYLHIFSKSSDTMELYEHIDHYFNNACLNLIIESRVLPTSGKIYDYIVRNSITSIPEYRSRGVFYLVRIVDS